MISSEIGERAEAGRFRQNLPGDMTVNKTFKRIRGVAKVCRATVIVTSPALQANLSPTSSDGDVTAGTRLLAVLQWTLPHQTEATGR